MNKEVIGVGSTEMEALSDAKKQLGVAEDEEINFEVIQRPEKKILGLFGGNPAKVKAWIEISPAQIAEDFIKSVLNAMNLKELTVEAQESEKGVNFKIEGDDIGYVIGRRGETLDALQYLTSLVVNHNTEESYFKVTVDTGNYREKRENTLEVLGRRIAIKVAKTGKKVVLEPMNPYERRIIHTAVQKINGAYSESEGENANRHVVILPDPKAKPYRRNNNYNRNRGRRPYTNTKPQEDSNAPKREPINEGGEFGLYGRIDK